MAEQQQLKLMITPKMSQPPNGLDIRHYFLDKQETHSWKQMIRLVFPTISYFTIGCMNIEYP